MIRILTDSTADFSMADAAALGVAVVPLTVSFGDAHYQDGIDLPLERFYDMLAAADKLPTTSQPARSCFFPTFLPPRRPGDTVICVLLSAALSGTCQSAEIAKEEAEYDNIYIVDSRSATLGLQLLVRRAVQRVAEGFSAMDIVADLETRPYPSAPVCGSGHAEIPAQGRPPFRRGCHRRRPAGHQAVLSLDARGKLGMVDKARGMPGAYVAIFKGIDRCGGIDEAWPVVVGYSAAPRASGPFACYVTQNLHLQKPMVQAIGTVIAPMRGRRLRIAFFANGTVPR